MFTVAKGPRIRLVQDIQELNKIMVQDLGLPPWIDKFAEEFVE